MSTAWARCAALVGALAAGVGCSREDGRADDRDVRTVQVSQVIVVAPAPGAPAVLYATFANRTGRADSLVGLSTPAADSATLHTQQSRGTMVVMQPVRGVAIPAGAAAQLAPGHFHGMLAGLRAQLASGDSVPVTFRFAASPTVTLTAHVVGYAELGRALEHGGAEGP